MDVLSKGKRLVDFEWQFFPFQYDRFRSSIYCDRYQYYLDLVEPSIMYDSFIHGIAHAFRVAFYCSVIAWLRGIEEDKANTVIIGGLLHDVGRANDKYDPKHGKASVDKLKSNGYDCFLSTLSEDNRALLFRIIEAHCDNRIFPGWCRYVKVEEPEAFPFITILKDSDVLDRVRLGGRERLYFFNDEAEQLKAFAAEVFSKYGNIK